MKLLDWNFKIKRERFYFTTHKHLAYRTSYTVSDKIKHSRAYECYHCSNYYIEKTNMKIT